MKHERNEDKNDFLLFLLPEIFTVIAGSTAVYAMVFSANSSPLKMLCETQ